MDSWCIEKGDTKATVQWIGEANQTRWTVCPLPVFVPAQYSSDPPRSGTRQESVFATALNGLVRDVICQKESSSNIYDHDDQAIDSFFDSRIHYRH
jgi:hypothetical protein